MGQYIGTAPPPPLPAAPRPGEIETPAAALARAIRTLAQSPRNFPALINAGRAALDLGDTQAAIGFFGRAEDVSPSSPAPKIGMGAAAVANGDASGALRWFYQAQGLGASAAAIGADRGLAQDLLGNQVAAQTDYRAALAGPEADEARRRLALSLGISGDRAGAFAILQPLLLRRDPAAQRIRAFVLALVGDERGASAAIESAMPGSGGRMAGFFRLLPSLSAPQKAAAVHLGVFPDPREIRVAAVSPRLLQPAVPDRRAPPAVKAPTKPAYVPAPVVSMAPPQTIASTQVNRPTLPAVTVPDRIASAAPTVSETPAPGFAPVVGPAGPLNSGLASQRIASASTEAIPISTNSPDAIAPVGADRLSGIDRLLARADDLPVPPAPQPRFETPAKADPVDDGATRKAAAAKKAADAKKLADAKKAADAKKVAEAKKLADAKKAAEEKREREAIGIAGTNWVQLAGGAHADRMATEFRRLAAKSSALRKKGGAVTTGKDYFRLLTGPFATKAAAQEFVNQLAKDGVDGFSWTRTPSQIKIEKLAPK